MILRCAALAAILVGSQAWAFPEMVRHGYMNCTSCHISPTGGGILNDYGRVQSEEVLSTWAREGEGNFLHGALPTAKTTPMSFGGQFRVLQMRYETPSNSMARFILMQADVEGALKHKRFDVVATLGLQNTADPLISRRHYLMYRPSDESFWSFRAGRFLSGMGILLSDHVVVTKDGLNFGQGTESYNLEVAYSGEHWDAFATVILGQFGPPADKGVLLRGSYHLGDRSKVGMSYYYGNRPTQSRHVFGPYAIVGFTEHFFLLAEFDLQQITDASSSRLGPALYWRLDCEVHKGIHVYATHEYANTRYDTATSKTVPSFASGIGVQFFPRPHFEFRAEYSRRAEAKYGGQEGDYAWVLAHYYL